MSLDGGFEFILAFELLVLESEMMCKTAEDMHLVLSSDEAHDVLKGMHKILKQHNNSCMELRDILLSTLGEEAQAEFQRRVEEIRKNTCMDLPRHLLPGEA